MGKHSKHGSGGGGTGAAHNEPSSDSKREEKLQAVLLADSFTRTFRPITLDPTQPSKVLCPLNNVTMLDYSIEFLAGAGVHEIFVFCVRGADVVERYVQRSSWTSVIHVHCVKDPTCTNPGDALRELDKRGLVRSDPFILMSGDVVTNVDIVPILAAHKARHKADSSAIMTMLFKSVEEAMPVGSGGRHSALRSARDDLKVGFNPRDRRVLLYDDNVRNSSIRLPCSFFATQTSTVEIRSDLLDVGIEICSPDVLARFSDEFDLSRKQFVQNSVAEEEEGLQNKIYGHLLGPSEYGARVHDFRSYGIISRDLLRRWCYPVVPDNLPSGYEKMYRYVLGRHYVYREVKGGPSACDDDDDENHHDGRQTRNGGRSTKIARSTNLGKETMVGANCRVGNRCTIRGSVVGNGCDVGDGVAIVDSHLWEGVVIEDDVTIVGSILCEGCIIRKGASLGTGCVIGKGCIIGTGVTLPEFSRITAFSDDADEDGFDDNFSSSSSSQESSEESSETDEWLEGDGGKEPQRDVEQTLEQDGLAGVSDVVSDHNVVGMDGVGRVWHPPSPEDDPEYESDSDEEWGEAFVGPTDLQAQSIGYKPSELYKKRMEVQRARETDDDEFVTDEDDLSDEEKENVDEEGAASDFAAAAGMTFVGAGPTVANATPEGDEEAFIIGRQRGVDVVKELKGLCLEHDKSSPVTNLAIELNSFKFSQNATYADCCVGALLALLELLHVAPSTSPGRLAKDFRKEMEYWMPLFQKLCQGIDEETAMLYALEALAVGGNDLGEALSNEPAFRFILQTAHDMEFLSEEAMLAWAAERTRHVEDDDSTSRAKLFLQKPTQEFLNWLREESESESGSGSDEGDSEEEEYE